MPLPQFPPTSEHGVTPVAVQPPAAAPQPPARPFLDLSDLAIQHAFLGAALMLVTFGTVFAIFTEHAIPRGATLLRDFLPIVLASTGIQMLCGVAAGLIIYRAVPRYAALIATILAIVIVYFGATWFFAADLKNMSDPAYIGMQVWHWAPFSMLLTAAALGAIPRHLFESAAMDRLGAGFTFRKLTFPLIAPALLLCLLYLLSRAFIEQLQRSSISNARHGHLVMVYGLLIGPIVIGALVSQMTHQFRCKNSAGGG